MNIIVLRIPDTTTHKEFKQLITDLLAKRVHIPFTDYPEVTHCGILSLKDNQGIIEHHGLVAVIPDQAGEWLLNHFKGQHIHNKLVFAKEYIIRSSQDSDIEPQDDRRRVLAKVDKLEEVQFDTRGLEIFLNEHRG